MLRPIVLGILFALLAAGSLRADEPSFDDLWTPKPHLGKGDLPREKEADWKDGRIRQSDTGPFYTAALLARKAVPSDDRTGLPAEDMVTKALAIKLRSTSGAPAAAVMFDKDRMTLRCGWTGAFLHHSDRRYGLLEMPTIGGEIAFTNVTNAWESVSPEELEWKGLHRHGNDVVLSYRVAGRAIRELNGIERSADNWAFTRTIEMGPGKRELRTTLATTKPREVRATLIGSGATLSTVDDRIVLTFPASDVSTRVKVLLGVSADLDTLSSAPPADLDALTMPGPRLWGDPLATKGEIGKPASGSPFAIDTIAIPYDNPHKALFFAGGFDFAPDGTCYLSTAHGDVWRITGIDDDLDDIRWQRFATGLYQPLGLKVREGEIFVLGRDQVTRLHDLNNDGEADFYENFNDDLTDHGQPHAYAMCLETDREGNFYFLKSGAPKTPHGGTLLKLSADGKQLDVIATGFRHANGLGIGPDGTITTADNEGNWTPVTRVDIVEPHGFYGHLPTAHLDTDPTDPGRPLCWLPRVIDNSAGGQAWVPQGMWGSLGGALLHLSFGRCTANVILKEQVDGVWQGGAVVLPTPRFLSGVCRARFQNDQLYLCGLNGWSSDAAKDGCFQRVRYTGGPIPLPTGVHIYENGIELTFAEPLDRKLAADAHRYAVEIWNYQWTKEYGSKDYHPDDPTREGRAALKVTAATVSADGRAVFVTIEGLKPVMQLRVQAGLKTATGAALPLDYYGTIHRLKPPREPK
ncbi:MAG: DUF6797 domain-containing protein [Tepidisphaeraceae bacterium]